MTEMIENKHVVGSRQLADVVVVGAGLSGIYQLYRLLKDGLNVVAFEAASGVGGVWFWNSYPGARVDSHFPHYQYWFSKALWDDADWSERFPAQPEIARYFNHVVDKFDLRRHIHFETRVVSAVFDEASGLWTVRTNKGHEVQARFVVFNTGGLSEPKVPEIAGRNNFAGQTFHTSRWPSAGVDLAGKRVGVVGTAATGIQLIQAIAPVVGHLTVFQRTPNYAIAIQNPKLTEADLDAMRSSFDELHAQVHSSRGGLYYPGDTPPMFDDLPAEERERHLEAIWTEGNLRLWAHSFADTGINPAAAACVSAFVRRKIRARIKDPLLAAKLVPEDYYFGTRRVPLENGFYELFARDNVALVDLREEPFQTMDAAGVNTTKRHHDLDVIIYATGFDAGVGALGQIDIRGNAKRSLKDAWEESLRTTVGMQVHGFPNLFMTMAPFAPAAAICNVPVCIDQQCDWIADTINFVRRKGHQSIQPSAATEEAWMAHHREVSEPTLLAQNKNSWYRRIAADGTRRELIAYMGGIPRYRQVCDAMRDSDYEGFELT